jgi:PAT family beta-lactamase induction signal transducer AmpG
MSSDEAPIDALPDMPVIKAPHTSIFLILLMPFGISTGYVGITLTFLLGSHGMAALAIASLMALSTFPQTFKVLWAPIIDTTLTPKRWYLIGAFGVGATIIAMSVIPAPAKAMALLGALVMVSSVASTFTSMASETFMANLAADQQAKASGWSQAGNFAGGGLGGALGLYLAEHVKAQWVSGAALGVFCMVCALPLLWLTAQTRTHMRPTLHETMGEVARDVWHVVRARAGLLVILLMLLPLGSGGAATTMTAKAGEWRVGADLVESVGGVMSGLVSAIAAVAGGYLMGRLDRRTVYCIFGMMVGLVLIPTAFAPRTPMTWIVSSLGYAAIIAACYTAYSAVVLEAIGKGAAATKFNLMASVSNVPVLYMPLVDGWLHDTHGTNAMFFGETAISIAAALFFGAVVVGTRRWRPAVNSSAEVF